MCREKVKTLQQGQSGADKTDKVEDRGDEEDKEAEGEEIDDGSEREGTQVRMSTSTPPADRIQGLHSPDTPPPGDPGPGTTAFEGTWDTASVSRGAAADHVMPQASSDPVAEW